MVDSTDPTALTLALAALRSAAPQATSSAGGAASTVAVSNFPASQAITGTVTANAGSGIMAVSAAAWPLPTGAATDGTDITTPAAMPAGGSGIRGWLSAIWTKLNGTLATSRTWSLTSATDNVTISGTLSGITNPVAVTGTFWQATQPVSVATNTPDVTDRTGRLLGHVTVDTMPTTPVTGTFWQATQPVSGTVTANIGTLPTLTKGTQGATGFTAQDLKDAGRTAVVLSATAVASVTSEAMFTLNIWKAGTVTSASSYTVTAGKTFRIQAVQFGARFTTPSTTVTFANCRFNIRSGSLITSPLVYGDSKLASANMPTPNSDLAVPDGLELAAGTVIGVSHLDSATTLLLDLLIVGYEY